MQNSISWKLYCEADTATLPLSKQCRVVSNTVSKTPSVVITKISTQTCIGTALYFRKRSILRLLAGVISKSIFFCLPNHLYEARAHGLLARLVTAEIAFEGSHIGMSQLPLFII